MSRVVSFTEVATEEVEAADAWWRMNRPNAPDAVLQEISRAVELIGVSPGVGTVVRGTRYLDTRKLVLRSISYLLYYRVTSTGVEVLRVWHASRRAPPRL